MPPEQDPTQTIKAPDGMTPDTQAGPTGGGGDTPEGEGGKVYDQAYVDRLNQKLEGEKQELARISTERDTYKGNAEMLTRVNTPVPVTTAAPAPGVQYVEGTYLTAEENAALTKSQENIVPEETNRLQRLERSRENAASQAILIRGIGAAATAVQSTSAAQSELNTATEFNDPAVRQKLLLEAQAAGSDPTQANRFASAQMNVTDFGVVNPHILMDKLKDHRIKHGAAVKAEEVNIAPESHDALGGEGPGSAHPAAGATTFDANTHLTASERSGAVKGMELKGFPTSGLTDKGDAYNKIWKGLSEEVKVYRLAHGAPEQGPEQQQGVAAKTIWSAKKKG